MRNNYVTIEYVNSTVCGKHVYPNTCKALTHVYIRIVIEIKIGYMEWSSRNSNQPAAALTLMIHGYDAMYARKMAMTITAADINLRSYWNDPQKLQQIWR